VFPEVAMIGVELDCIYVDNVNVDIFDVNCVYVAEEDVDKDE